MKIAIAGSHGLIGTNLVTHFRKLNNNVTRIVRSKDQNGIYWDPRTGYINHENLDGYDVIINLCGEKIASLNPFFKNKNNLISSRVNTNLILSKTIAKLNNPPKFFITASATGIYKPSKRRITESSKFNQGFLAQLALEWEEASKFYSNDKTKIINLRLGQVISSDSFYFKAMSNISKYMKISSFGNGRQRWPWVSINDINKSIDFIIESKILLNNNSFSVDYYFGPNDYKILDNISTDFDKNIYLGFETIGVRAFNKYFLIPIFNFLKNFTSNYGLIILLMVIVIRLIITPLTYKSHISMAKMKVLNPEIQSIREKHDGDMQKSQAETMELYQKTGVSPLGGCLPIVLQMPILISVFYFIPNMIEFRGKSFLWASDLSTYDSIIDLPFSIPFYGSHISLFTLLMAFSIMLMNKTNMQMQANMDGPMKYFQYFIPVMMLFFFNSFASGLTYYYFLTNIATYGQMNIFKRFVDESKIKEEIEFNKKRNINSKKSSFQIRLDEAMKARQNKNKK